MIYKHIFIGPINYPTTGRITVTVNIYNNLKTNKNILFLDVSKGTKLNNKYINLIIKLIKYLKALFYLIFLKGKTLSSYMVVEDKRGLWLNILIIFLLKKKSNKIFLHHHSSIYITKFNYRMKLLLKLGATKIVNITQCKLMAEALNKKYNIKNFSIALPNAFCVPLPNNYSVRIKKRFIIGYLGNISYAKGVDILLDLYVKLHNEYDNIKLIIAGKMNDEKIKNHIFEMKNKYAESIELLGPIFGQDKEKFFSSINIFIFPTRTETEGIVTLESLSFGKPVIAYGRMCIPSNITESGGLVISPNEDFIKFGFEYISKLINDENLYREVSTKSISKFKSLRKSSINTLEQFINQFLEKSNEE